MYKISKNKINGHEIHLIEVKHEKIEITFMNYGAAIKSILVPDKNGMFETVLIDYDDLASYIENPIYLNAIIGPTSGRIKNASFEINDVQYTLDKNHLGMANLHGGSETFAYKTFDYHVEENASATRVIFRLRKLEEESKYPGNQQIEIVYTIENTSLLIEFNAKTDKDTLLNLTNHAYFNLSGNLKSNILEHELYLNSSNIVELDEYSIPYKVKSISNTNLDYKIPRKVQSNGFNGIDHPFLIDNNNFQKPCAIIRDFESKRMMEVFTDYECFVCYTHEYPGNSNLLNAKKQVKNMGICFETQHAPNGIHIEGLEDSILRHNESYNYKTLYKFSNF